MVDYISSQNAFLILKCIFFLIQEKDINTWSCLTAMFATSFFSPSNTVSFCHTLYNVLLRIARNLLETRENVKISTHPF